MKAKVNPETCIGCGLCTDMCPEVFEMNEDGIAEAKAGEVKEVAVQSCHEAANACPVEAIEIEE